MSLPNHRETVEWLHRVSPPPPTLDDALIFLRRLISVLPAEEGAGLLKKPTGENIISYQGTMVSAGRLCYPDGHVVKVLTDVPTTNGPTWDDNGLVDRARYLPTHERPSDNWEPPDLPRPSVGRPYDERFYVTTVGPALMLDYQVAGRTVGDDAAWIVWGARIEHDYQEGLSLAESFVKHRAEWRNLLGLR